MFSNFFSGKRVFLTGHTGFKGSWLAEWLLMLGAEVHGYALDPQPHETLFYQLGLAARLASDTRADLSDRTALANALDVARPDVVFHLAAQPLVRLSYDIPVETFATNVMGTVHVLDAVRSAGRPCSVVCITTDKCYENREWLHAYREEDAMGGHDPYSASKGAAELVIAAYRRSFFSSQSSETPSSETPSSETPTSETPSSETPFIFLASARAGNVIGGGDWAKDRIIPDCIRAIRAGESIPVRNKIATRPWQHVLEPLSGYLWLAAVMGRKAEIRNQIAKQGPYKAEMEEPNSSAEPSSFQLSTFNFQLLCGPFNFGPALTSNRTVAELVQELLKHTGGEWTDACDPNAVHEASKLNLATDKAFHLLGWQPVWDFATTIGKTAEWYTREGNGDCPGALTLDQIQAYYHDAAAKGLPWASNP